jgi:hypothetical protein
MTSFYCSFPPPRARIHVIRHCTRNGRITVRKSSSHPAFASRVKWTNISPMDSLPIVAARTIWRHKLARTKCKNTSISIRAIHFAKMHSTSCLAVKERARWKKVDKSWISWCMRSVKVDATAFHKSMPIATCRPFPWNAAIVKCKRCCWFCEMMCVRFTIDVRWSSVLCTISCSMHHTMLYSHTALSLHLYDIRTIDISTRIYAPFILILKSFMRRTRFRLALPAGPR